MQKMAAHNADYARSASNQNDHPDEKHYSKESFVKDIEEWIDKLNVKAQVIPITFPDAAIEE